MSARFILSNSEAEPSLSKLLIAEILLLIIAILSYVYLYTVLCTHTRTYTFPRIGILKTLRGIIEMWDVRQNIIPT